MCVESTVEIALRNSQTLRHVSCGSEVVFALLKYLFCLVPLAVFLQGAPTIAAHLPALVQVSLLASKHSRLKGYEKPENLVGDEGFLNGDQPVA